MAEMGDKTQFATIALAARFNQLLTVILTIWNPFTIAS